MRPTRILLRFKKPQSRTVKAFANVRDHQPSYPKQLHLGYFNIDESLDAVKGDLFRALVEKWPRKQKPKAIDWADTETKLAKLRLAASSRSVLPSATVQRDPTAQLLSEKESLDSRSVSPSPEGGPRVELSSSGALTAEALAAEVTLSQSAPSDNTIDPAFQAARGRPLHRDFSERTGDVGDFEKIARQHQKHLRKKALRLAQNPAAADDLVQETLMRALGRFHTFQQGSNALAWLSIIMLRLHLDTFRRLKIERIALDEGNIPDDEYDTSNEGLFKAISDEDLSNAILSLEPNYREVIDCCYFMRMNYRDAAEHLDVPVGTVGTRLLFARKRLKEILLQHREAW